MAVFNGNNQDNVLTGSDSADTLNGFGGDDILKGLGGADQLNGGSGEDMAAYDASPTSVLVDLANGGIGGHASGDSYNSIENVFGSEHGDTLLGDGNDNKMDGSKGGDTIKGGGGADELIGGKGGDFLEGNNGRDTLKGGKGGDGLVGSNGRDTLRGGNGSDDLAGDGGNDTMTGGAGVDFFGFRTPLDGNNNVDVITDFTLNTDKIALASFLFSAIGSRLNNREFVKANSAQDGNDHIIYKTNNGKLYYDEDGQGGSAKVQFAKLSGSPNGLDKDDFIVFT